MSLLGQMMQYGMEDPNTSRGSFFARRKGLEPLEMQIANGIPLTQQQRDLLIKAGATNAPTSVWAMMAPHQSDQDLFSGVVARLQNQPELFQDFLLPAAAIAMTGGAAAGALTGAGYSAGTAGAITGGGTGFVTSGGDPAAAATGALGGYAMGSMFDAPGGGTPAASGGSSAGTTGAAAAAGGPPMPPAQALPPELLLDMGLVETAPGVWMAGGAGAASSLPATAPEGPSMPPAVPEPASLPSFLTNPSVLGALGGAVLGSGVLGGGSEAGTVETEEGLPDWLMPYAKPALDKYTSELQNYQTDPYGIMPSAMQEFQKTISGMYLDPATNKYLEDYFKLGSERIRTNLSPSFGHMQAFGQHSGYNEALARGLGDFATGLYGGNYAKERDRQTTMTAAAPSFLGQASTQQFAPYQQYLNTIGNLGKKKEQPYFDNPMGNIIGGGMLGYGLGKAFK